MRLRTGLYHPFRRTPFAPLVFTRDSCYDKRAILGDSLIGKTADSGSAIPGSSPGLPEGCAAIPRGWLFSVKANAVALIPKS